MELHTTQHRNDDRIIDFPASEKSMIPLCFRIFKTRNFTNLVEKKVRGRSAAPKKFMLGIPAIRINSGSTKPQIYWQWPNGQQHGANHDHVFATLVAQGTSTRRASKSIDKKPHGSFNVKLNTANLRGIIRNSTPSGTCKMRLLTD